MSEKCWRCRRSLASCCCDWIHPIETGIKFVFLMHAKEARRQRTGTGRLASLSLAGSEIRVGVDFSDDAIVNELIADPANFAVVLYPAADALFTDDPAFRASLAGRRPVIFVIDSTWALSRQIMRLSVNLHGLPRLSFRREYRSRFRIKTQPKPECLSTIESAYYLIEELKDSGLVDASVRAEGLMDVFTKMVDYQIFRSGEGKVRV